MIRKFGFVVLVMALIVSACGRQVTPNRFGSGAGGNLPAGFMSVKFRVQQPFNFAKYKYVVVFDTTGDGVTPLPNGTNNNYLGYSFALVIQGTTGSATVQAGQYLRPPGAPTSQLPTLQFYSVPQQLLYWIPNSNGLNTEYTIIFDRRIFTGLIPLPSGTATPTPTPTPSGATPSPTPSATPFGTVWTFNYLTADATTSNVVDSLGSGGATDQTFTSPALNTLQPFDQTFYAATHLYPPTDPSSALAGGEISNNP